MRCKACKIFISMPQRFDSASLHLQVVSKHKKLLLAKPP
jgi:hypothetical protein